MEVSKKRAQWRCYKPTKDGKGAASRLEVKIVSKDIDKDGKKFELREVQTFWVSAPQIGMDADDNASFAWSQTNDDRVITVKIGESDIGEILAVLNGRKKNTGGERGIYHQHPNGSTGFNLEQSERGGYKVRISKKDKSGKVSAIVHSLSTGEGEILKVLLESVIRQSYQW